MSKGNFNCNGKVNINDWQLNNSSLLLQNEIDNVLSEKKAWSDANVNVFDSELPGINVLLNLKHFVRYFEAKLKQLDRHEILTDSGKQRIIETYKHIDFSHLRVKICEFLYYLRNYLQSIKEENFALKDISDDAIRDFDDLLGTIRRFLCRLYQMPVSTFLYATSNVGNKCNHPEYHMYHIHLDLRWLIISLIFVQNSSWGCLDNKSEELENIIYTVIQDLIYISLKIFETITNGDLKSRTPYACTCTRELWIMLQIFIDDLAVKRKCKIFWAYVGRILRQLYTNELNNYLTIPQRNISLPYCKNPELFCTWLTYHLILLYGYTRNGGYCSTPSSRFAEPQNEASIDIVEKILKAYVNKGGKNGARDEIDEELCVIIPLLHVLSFDWWKPQVQIVTLLWECFHRRLEQPFLMQTRGPWCTSSEKKTPMDILNQVRARIKSTSDMTSSETSFSFFLRLLGTVLQKNYNCNDLKIWNQIKGRIYSRFSQNKIREFTESGLYNFVNLFITLAVTADTINVCSAMVNLLPSILESTDSSDNKRSSLIWKSKLIVLLLYNEQRLPFNSVAEDFIETVNAISCRKDEGSRSMMIWFIDVLRLILTQSDYFERSEHCFLGGWIDRYLLECSPNKVTILTSVLLRVFDKCDELQSTNAKGCSLMLNGLWKHVASRIRQMATTTYDLSTTGFYENPTKLAVAFTLEACRDPVTAKKYGHSATSLFHHFTTSIIIKDTRITKLYLSLILQKTRVLQYFQKEIQNFNTICIQAWIKCSVLNNNVNNNEAAFLVNYIGQLPEIKEILSLESDANELLNSDESIIAFLTIVSKYRKQLTTEQQRASFDAKCKPFFHNIDKWILQLINEDNKESRLSIWIYKCIGAVIYYCSAILYVKNQLNSTLRMLINKVALPPEQTTSHYTLHLSQRIFWMIILGIGNLNVKSDISLQTLIRELFETYLPLLVRPEGKSDHSYKVSESLSRCFTEAGHDFVCLILGMLAGQFITVVGGDNVHKLCPLVMALLRNIVKSNRANIGNVTLYVVDLIDTSILNCYMRVHNHHPHRRQTIALLKDLFKSPYLLDKHELIMEKLKRVTWNALYKYIVSNTKTSFEFLRSTYFVNGEFFNYLLSRAEDLVSEYEKQKKSFAPSLRYLLSNVTTKI